MSTRPTEGESARGRVALGLLLTVATATVLAQAPEPVAPPVSPPAPAATLDATYLANEGFMVEGGGVRVLVDALFGPGVTGYPVLPEATRAELERGAGPFAGVTVALASHHHPDHFDPGTVARFLVSNPEAVFVSTPQAVARLEQEVPGAESLRPRLRAVLPPAGQTERLEIGGAGITVLNLHHGPRDPPVENLGFVVALGRFRFLHFGDTEAKMDDFRPYLELLRGTDIALLPFWFLSSEWRVEMVRIEIAPRSIVVAHLPLPDAPPGHFGRWQTYDDLLALIRSNFPEARIPAFTGESYRFEFEGEERDGVGHR